MAALQAVLNSISLEEKKPVKRRRRRDPCLLNPLDSCADKSQEQGVRSVGPALELGMVLDTYKKVLVREFYCFYKPVVR